MGHPYAGKTRPAGYATTPGSILTGPEPFRQLSKSSASGHLKGTVPVQAVCQISQIRVTKQKAERLIMRADDCGGAAVKVDRR